MPLLLPWLPGVGGLELDDPEFGVEPDAPLAVSGKVPHGEPLGEVPGLVRGVGVDGRRLRANFQASEGSENSNQVLLCSVFHRVTLIQGLSADCRSVESWCRSAAKCCPSAGSPSPSVGWMAKPLSCVPRCSNRPQAPLRLGHFARQPSSHNTIQQRAK